MTTSLKKQGGRMRKVLIPILSALTALAALAVATGTAGGSTAAAKSPTVTDQTLIRCGRTRSLGIAAPVTGDAASIGTQQARWARFWITRYNRSHRRTKFKAVVGDTQLPDTAQAIQVAERMASNSAVLGMVGPAGSQEVQVSTAPLKNGGLGFVSGSATRTSLTTDGTRRGYFFRVVPNDDQQGPRVANYIRNTLRHTRVAVVDAQNSYSTGLADTVQARLRGAGATVQRESVNEKDTTDFSSLAARIPGNTQSVYIPWQLAPKAQLFGQALRSQGKQAILFGSDGLFDPDSFKIAGSYVSFFPIDLASPVIRAYRNGPGKGKSELFGLPSYQAADVVGRAIDKACANGSATRGEVRKFIGRTNLAKKQTIVGFRVKFVQARRGVLGPGDMATPANFGIYRINTRGVYVRVS
jgi:branched-chain amino acid transport system substrate-binding protein